LPGIEKVFALTAMNRLRGSGVALSINPFTGVWSAGSKTLGHQSSVNRSCAVSARRCSLASNEHHERQMGSPRGAPDLLHARRGFWVFARAMKPVWKAHRCHVCGCWRSGGRSFQAGEGHHRRTLFLCTSCRRDRLNDLEVLGALYSWEAEKGLNDAPRSECFERPSK
jgi:hypothetical protein